MIKLKGTQIGNSRGAVLPKEALARLNLEKGDEMFLELSWSQLHADEADWMWTNGAAC